MKSFRDYISEEVVPTALVKDGSIDIDKEEVRASINMALAKVTSDSSITPYIALNRISKALSMFHIILPKRVYLEGAKGVEVHELRQFGDKMGMNDQGEFINEVPGKYYLFIQYGMNTPMNSGGQYAYPTMAGTFRVTAKVVDPIELNRLLDVAEITVSEECNAETQQLKAKMLALKEPMKNVDDSTEGTEDAANTTQRKKDKKLSAASLDEELSHGARELTLHADNDQQLHRSSHQPIIKNLSRKHAKGQYDHEKAGKLWKYHADRAAKSYEKQHGGKFSVADRKAAASHFADSARDEHGFGSVKKESIDEAMTRKQKDMAVRRFMSHDPKAGESILAMGKKEREEKKSFDSAEKEANKWQKHRLKEEEQLDEVNVKQIKKDIDSGMSHDAVIGKHANKRTTNTDEIRKVIKQHTWDKRMKKEETQIGEEEKKLYKVGATKKDKSGRTVERRDYATHSSIVATHDKEGKSLQNKWGGYNPDRTGTPKYIGKHFKNLEEKQLTPAETRKKEEIVKSMKKGLAGFKERYGKRAKEVMYATATKRAKQVAEKLEFDPSTEIPKNS